MVIDAHPNLTIEVTAAFGTQTIALAGEADLSRTPGLEVVLRGAAASDSRTVVIDLRDLTFIDSSGLHVLMAGYDLCRARGQEVRIIPGPRNVQRLFEITGIDEILPFHHAAPPPESSHQGGV